ncbi:hypothetical protein [Pontibacter sp. SGAir0037]|uniref:hypothetical protein n=1 Tax=Pontibacter sp. SGAir0037 TaxID=2571030 RepID=UPI0010F7F6DB|nr:hypothetical protein [Pontibacter sp. SGAir0037]
MVQLTVVFITLLFFVSTTNALNFEKGSLKSSGKKQRSDLVLEKYSEEGKEKLILPLFGPEPLHFFLAAPADIVHRFYVEDYNFKVNYKLYLLFHQLKIHLVKLLCYCDS